MNVRIISLVLAVIFLSTVFACGEEARDEKKPVSVTEMVTKSVERIAGGTVALDKIVVSPDKLREPAGLSANSISVVSSEDIEGEKKQFAKDIISEYNSIALTETGAFGGSADIRIRGANPNHTVLLIDGVKVYDPSSASGGFNFANLTLDNVDRIEIVRGPQSTLYGSDAMGGIVSMESKKPDAPFFETGVESGSYYSLSEYVNLGGFEKGLHYSFGFSQFNTNGISKADPVTIPNIQETDPYTRKSFSARLDYEVAENLTIGGTIRDVDARYEYDNPGSTTPRLRDNDELVGKSNLLVYSIYAEQKLFDFYDYSTTYSYVNTFRRNYDYPAATNDWYEGAVNRFDYQNNFHLLDYDTFTVGYDHSQDISDSYSASRTSVNDQPKVFARNSALYLQNKAHYEELMGSTQNMRVDSHSQFGTNVTYKIDGFYSAPTQTRVRGLWATSFKAPSLYQLYAPANTGWLFLGGNSALQPEKGRSYEFGLDQYLFDKRFRMGATYFYNRFYNLIKYTTDATTRQSSYQNAAKAKSLGMEYEIEANLFNGRATVSSGFDFTETKDYSTDNELVRVPKNQFNFKAKLKPVDRLFIGMDIYYNGINLSAGTDKMKPYTKVDLVAELTLIKGLSIYGRIENLLNKHYQEVRGYAEPGFSAYGGIRAKF